METQGSNALHENYTWYGIKNLSSTAYYWRNPVQFFETMNLIAGIFLSAGILLLKAK